MAGQCVLSLASSQMVSKGKVLYFSHCLRAFHRLLLLLFRFFRLPQRMEGSLTDLIRDRERIPTQEIDMIIPQRGKTFHILWYDLHPSSSHLLQRSIDRKSTRLNSSHLVISYAVFCLHNKTTHTY